MSPATKSLYGVKTCDTDTNTELCYYCYEYTTKDEIFVTNGRPICLQCEIVEYDGNYHTEKGDDDEQDNTPF